MPWGDSDTSLRSKKKEWKVPGLGIFSHRGVLPAMWASGTVTCMTESGWQTSCTTDPGQVSGLPCAWPHRRNEVNPRESKLSQAQWSVPRALPLQPPFSSGPAQPHSPVTMLTSGVGCKSQFCKTRSNLPSYLTLKTILWRWQSGAPCPYFIDENKR